MSDIDLQKIYEIVYTNQQMLIALVIFLGISFLFVVVGCVGYLCYCYGKKDER